MEQLWKIVMQQLYETIMEKLFEITYLLCTLHMCNRMKLKCTNALNNCTHGTIV
jgi:hypothetical protein